MDLLSSAEECFSACVAQYADTTCIAWCGGDDDDCGDKSCWCEEIGDAICMADEDEWQALIPFATEIPSTCQGAHDGNDDYDAWDDYYNYDDDSYYDDDDERCGFAHQGTLAIGDTVTGDTGDSCSLIGEASNDHYFWVSLDEDTKTTCGGNGVMLSTCGSSYDTVCYVLSSLF